jgi:hypothetical protein
LITFLGSLLGFIGSAFPEFLRVYRDQKDRAHELQILDRQMQMIQQGHQFRLEEINAQADASATTALYSHAKATGVQWVDAMAGTVRPVITYAFFLLYALMKCSQWTIAKSMAAYDQWAEAFVNIWHIEDQALFATVISFWFGQRMLQKAREWPQKK